MPRPIGSITTPSYRHYKRTNQAVVTIDGQDHYLGTYGTQESRNAYDRLIGEWLANGRCLRRVEPDGTPSDMRIVELCGAFWKHAQSYYQADSTNDGELSCYKPILSSLRRLYGQTKIRAFGPTALKAVRQEMVAAGWCRTHVNRQIGRLRHMFRWGVENEMVPVTVYQTLLAVAGLRYGKSDVRESDPVRPVSDANVQAVLPHVASAVQAMIKLQDLTGMRPGEVVIMRGCNIDMSDAKLWTYTPEKHKTQHHGHSRAIYLGQRCQEIIRPFLQRDVTAYLFSPKEAEAARLSARHAARLAGLADGTTTPLGYGNSPGTNRVRRPRKSPHDRYTVHSYRRAIERGCGKAFKMPHEYRSRKTDTPEQRQEKLALRRQWRKEHVWHPHQLRHSAATKIRRDYGLEAAQVILGHHSLNTTQVYAEANVQAARQVMAAVG